MVPSTGEATAPPRAKDLSQIPGAEEPELGWNLGEGSVAATTRPPQAYSHSPGCGQARLLTRGAPGVEEGAGPKPLSGGRGQPWEEVPRLWLCLNSG